PHKTGEGAGVSDFFIIDGSIQLYDCSDCHKLFSDANGENVVTAESIVVSKEQGSHKPELKNAVTATCIKDGSIQHYECADCHKLFSDANGENVITAESIVVSKEQGSHALEAKSEEPATCLTDGKSAHWACELCNKLFSDENGENAVTEAELVISKTTVPHSLVKHNAVAATCIEDGNIAYWDCSVCEKYFSDAEAENEITASETVSPMTPDKHSTKRTAADEANCIKAGNIQYWQCKNCNKYFKDSKCTEETTAEGVIIPIDPSKHMLGASSKVNANCTNPGTEAYWNCYLCSKLFSDAEATTEIEMPVSIDVDPDAHVLKSVAANAESKEVKNSTGTARYTFKNVAYQQCNVCKKCFYSNNEVTAVLNASGAGFLIDLGYNSIYSSRVQVSFQAPNDGQYTFELNADWVQLSYWADNESARETVYTSAGWSNTATNYSKFVIDDAAVLNKAVINMNKGDIVSFGITSSKYVTVNVDRDHVLQEGENAVLIKTDDATDEYEYTFVAQKEKYSIDIPLGLYVEMNYDPLYDAGNRGKKVNFECEIGEEITFSFFGSAIGVYTVTIGEPVEPTKIGTDAPLTGYTINGDGTVSLGNDISTIIVNDDVTEGRYKLTITTNSIFSQASILFGLNYDGTYEDFKGEQWFNGNGDVYFQYPSANILAGGESKNITATMAIKKIEITMDLKAGDVLIFVTNNNNGIENLTITLEAVD
ncbi:MAG: hypothetical protein K2M36_04650, partial [Clostridia bacterium]|nr:hypothetical protein [Clostridia bacterium]